ncbi:MAG: pyridoxamine 5'-phosphate oxidase family protein [Candidatus Dormiibacterota bacterium]
MALASKEIAFLERVHSAAMITISGGGVPKSVRVGIAIVGGKLWSSGTRDRIRTMRLRRDPRCTLFVFDADYAWLGLETTVTILDGPDAASQNLQLFRIMQGRPAGALRWFGGELDDDAFLRAMVDEGRLIYEFDVHKSYGLV